jgi:phage head maturation protease
MVEYKVDGKGLWIKARVSAAAEIFSLVKDKVLTAFSVGFRIMDAEYNAAAEVLG